MSKRYVVLGLSVFLALALAVPALGGPSNPIANVSASAKKIAKKAKKKAKKAQQSANSAQNSADNAQGTANEALNTAQGAQTAAEGAQTAAEGAQAAADAAQATANGKFGTAGFVIGTASANNSVAPKSATATCPAGDQVAGGGWLTLGDGNNDITPTSSTFQLYSESWGVTMDEIGGGTGESWAVQAVASCLD